MRVFVALDLPESAKQTLKNLQQHLIDHGSGGRAAPLEQMHITLRFLSEQSQEGAEKVCSITQALFDKAQAPMLKIDGLGAFIRAAGDTIYAKLSGDLERTAMLHNTLSKQLDKQMRIQPELRPFLPHITLQRNADFAQLQRMSFQTEPFYVPSVSVYQSVLAPSGAQYQTLQTTALLR